MSEKNAQNETPQEDTTDSNESSASAETNETEGVEPRKVIADGSPLPGSEESEDGEASNEEEDSENAEGEEGTEGASKEGTENSEEKPAATSEDSPAFDESLTGETGKSGEGDDSELLAKLLVDPETVVNDIEQKVEKRLEAKAEAKLVNKKRWDGFFNENPALAKHKKVVEYVRKEIISEAKAEGKKLSWVEGAALLAKRTNSLIMEIKGIEGNEESDQESSNPSNLSVVSSSASAAPRKVKEPERPMTFGEELREFQRSRGLM